VISLNVVIKEPYADAAHVLVTVWAGPDPEHRQSCGTLHMTWDDALELNNRVMRGEVRTLSPELEVAIHDLMTAPMDLLEIAVRSLPESQRALLRDFLARVDA
jgi:hypothetical protein